MLKTCYRCGELYEESRYTRLCDDCKEREEFEKMPEPEDKGVCTCWHDGLDYKIHECEVRRKLARQRKKEGKAYIMPQCASCTEDMPQVIYMLPRCSICCREYQPTPGQVDRLCSNRCRQRYEIIMRKRGRARK